MGNGRKEAFKLIILFGVISLLGDIIYEGARGINAPYLKTLGADAAIVGLIAGAGEFLGYLIRLLSGYFSDKTKAYWFFTIVGYSFLIAVPLLALSNIWQFAAIFIILERIGKGIRSPAKDTIISHATKQIGTGYGFAIVEFLDQIGATIGPLIFTFFFISIKSAEKGLSDYQHAYSLMWLPFIFLILFLFITYHTVKNPQALEFTQEKTEQQSKTTKTFWAYTVFSFITTIGFVNFAIIGYHLKVHNIVGDALIPLFYAIAMAVDALIGLVIGKIYDKYKIRHRNEHAGLILLIGLPLITSVIPLFVFFSSNITLIICGIIFWGFVMGIHETIMKAGIADLTSISKRSTAYGIFSFFYGASMFLGSSLSGVLYEISIPLLVLVLIIIQALSIPVFLKMKKTIFINQFNKKW